MHKTDQSDDNFEPYRRGYTAGVAEIGRLFHAALESGAEGLADADVAQMLAREIEKIFARGPAANTAEGAGMVGGIANVLCGLAWRGFLTLPREYVQEDGIH